MKSAFERVAELHKTLHAGFCRDHEVRQSISDHSVGCGAYNQPEHALEFRTLLARGHIPSDSEQYKDFRQGFFAVEINMSVVWGGRQHDDAPITAPEIRFIVCDRLAGGMATQSWTYNGNWGDQIAFEDILPLVRSLIQPATPPTTEQC